MRFSQIKQFRRQAISGLGVTLVFLSSTAMASTFPDPAVEARTARELLAVESKMTTPARGSDTDLIRVNIATALARLGRLEAALNVAGQIEQQEADFFHSAPSMRGEVLRLVVRRRCMAGKLEEARQLIPAITIPRFRADALLALSRAHLRRGEMEQARQTLYQVPVLVEKDVHATSYTAYLLSKCGDLDGAKRLFARARKKLTPYKAIPSGKQKDVPLHNMEARNEHSALVRSLFKAGLVDEAIKVQDASRTAQEKDPFFYGISSDELAQINRFDDALRLAREEGGNRGIASRVYLALLLERRKKDRAGAINVLKEAEAEFRRLIAESSIDDSSVNRYLRQPQQRMFPLIYLACAWQELGEGEKARLLQEEALKDLKPDTAAVAKLHLAFIPIVTKYERDSVFPLIALEKIDAEFKILLPQLTDYRLGFGLCQWLIHGYKKIGRTEATRAYLPIMEQLAFAQVTPGADIDAYNSVLEVARLWRQEGDEVQVQRILQKADQLSSPKDVARRDVAQAMIMNGFIDEGRSRWEALPEERNRPLNIGYWEAKFQPHIFPVRISKIANLKVRLQELTDFTKGLTAPIYDTPQEREFVLSRGGYS